MSNNTTVTTGGISFSGALFILFLALKLTGVINWSWWWVTCPLWIGPAIVLASLTCFGLFTLIVCVATLVRQR